LRLRIQIESAKDIILPRSYNHILQSWLYNQISDPAYRLFLHNQGFKFEKRTFKLFTFSRLQGVWRTGSDKKSIIFTGQVFLEIASPLITLMQEVAHSLLLGPASYWNQNEITITGLESINETLTPRPDGKWQLSALSPIVTYSTIEAGNKKQTNYYHPGEPEFSKLIKSNLEKKSHVLHELGWDEYAPLTGDFHLRPLFDPLKKHGIGFYYKNFFIKGYMGDYELECSPEWIKLALDTGLGSKNAQGLGMVEMAVGPASL